MSVHLVPNNALGFNSQCHPMSPLSCTSLFLSRTVQPTRQKSLIGLKSEFGPRRIQSQNNSTQGLYTLSEHAMAFLSRLSALLRPPQLG